MHELYELKEKLMEELEKYGQEELTPGSLEVVDKLSHAIKNLHKIIEKCEEEDYSMEDGMSMNYARRGRPYAYEGQGGNQSYTRRGQSYARGRGRNAKRDSRGRYASEGGYSGTDEMIEELYGLMEDAPDDKTRKEFERFIKKVEMM